MTGTDPVIPVFPAGYEPVTADFNTWVQAPFTFLTSKVVFRAEYHGTTSLTANTLILIPFDTVLEDPYSGWNATTHQWLCPAGCSGWYEVSITGTADSVAVTTSALAVNLGFDGAASQGLSGDWAALNQNSATNGAFAVPLTAGFDTVSAYIFSGVTVNTPATAGQYPCIEIVWISE